MQKCRRRSGVFKFVCRDRAWGPKSLAAIIVQDSRVAFNFIFGLRLPPPLSSPFLSQLPLCPLLRPLLFLCFGLSIVFSLFQLFFPLVVLLLGGPGPAHPVSSTPSCIIVHLQT
ncbi:uncharacterized protein APUU_40396A [Aspergillus puulaauensis]|uniref:Transmembrane protein n=1 Tax=Aspergillus puulaauensis TaxID=1220207 RepID=A0A7R8AML9_9EURO|nr:uncharacterized protein APUU_40396A [Aspergillus puulaauensis]BCS23952.1 hypothetical protein APUU_40396A [Aspergillus puulaauensis]